MLFAGGAWLLAAYTGHSQAGRAGLAALAEVLASSSVIIVFGVYAVVRIQEKLRPRR